jgi:hypothetical protein
MGPGEPFVQGSGVVAAPNYSGIAFSRRPSVWQPSSARPWPPDNILELVEALWLACWFAAIVSSRNGEAEVAGSSGWSTLSTTSIGVLLQLHERQLGSDVRAGADTATEG